jgi:hypothetical protein
MRLTIRSGLTLAAAGAWLLLCCLLLAREAALSVAPATISIAALVSLLLALVAAARNAAYAWRGPRIPAFPKDEALVCRPREAAIVRAAAQLRGTLGGAGWIHRARLALSTGAWIAVGISVSAILVDAERASLPQWGFAVLVFGAASACFPPKAFFYREATNGCLLVHPRDTFAHLARSHDARTSEPGDERAEASTQREWRRAAHARVFADEVGRIDCGP